jgi:hypothetical protein
LRLKYESRRSTEPSPRPELRAVIAQRFGELSGRLNGTIGPDARARAKGEFRFANDKRATGDDDVIDLPRLPRTVVN